MNRKLLVAANAIAILIVGAATVRSQNLNQLSDAEKKAGWILLFDGKNIATHWNIQGGTDAGAWSVADSAMKCPGTGQMLFTKESYDNFEWKMDWKLNQKGNSGFFIRVPTPGDWLCGTYEYAILDDVNGDDATALGHLPGETTTPIKRTASVYDIYPTTQDAVPIPAGGKYVDLAKPYDQYNQGVIFANGNYVEHWLNGVKVVDFEIGSVDWENRYKVSKFPGAGYNCADNHYAKTPKGLLGIQDHGANLLIYARNLKIRPFTPGEKLVSPSVTPPAGNFDGTKIKVTLEVAITGATIRYTTNGTTPDSTSPIYKDTLVFSAATTLKARTFRPRFQASDVITATYVPNASALRPEATGRAALASAPAYAFRFGHARWTEQISDRDGKSLRIVNASGRIVKSFSAIKADGSALSQTQGSMHVTLDAGDLERGLYFLTSESTAFQARKILIY